MQQLRTLLQILRYLVVGFLDLGNLAFLIIHNQIIQIGLKLFELALIVLVVRVVTRHPLIVDLLDIDVSRAAQRIPLIVFHVISASLGPLLQKSRFQEHAGFRGAHRALRPGLTSRVVGISRVPRVY